MIVNIKATRIELTPALKEYIEIKFLTLEKLIQRWELESVVEARVEVARLNQHHHKGDVFRCEVNLHLPVDTIRAEAEEWDIRVAIDQVRHKLQRELTDFNERHKTIGK
ncbi:MAG: ribosome-associated translation inhibitor RaiA [Patescibacteria group bacterium]